MKNRDTEILPKRKAQRLQKFDYSTAGAYFITICVKEHRQILSVISYEKTARRDSPCGCPYVKLMKLGEICAETIPFIEEKYNVSIMDYVIMPNHIHLILWLPEPERTATRAVPTVSSVIGAYKSFVAMRWLQNCKAYGKTMRTLWERSFYDHIVRDDEDLYCKRRYIQENPIRWCIKNGLITPSEQMF